jgi:hypothetical protein
MFAERRPEDRSTVLALPFMQELVCEQGSNDRVIQVDVSARIASDEVIGGEPDIAWANGVRPVEPSARIQVDTV